MVTLRDVVDDIMLMGKQTIDDNEISFEQVAYWVVTAGNFLQAARTEKHGLETQDRSGLVMKRFVVGIQQANTGDDPLCGKYIVLPHTIYDYANDKGVDYMTYYYMGEECSTCPPRFSKVLFTRSTPSELHGYYANPYTKPSKKNPYFYREGEKLWLVGLETLAMTLVNKVEVGLLTTLPDVDENLDPDEEFRFPAERLSILRNYVLDLMRWSISMPNTKLVNDGTEAAPQQVMAPRTVSVNDPLVQQAAQG